MSLFPTAVADTVQTFSVGQTVFFWVCAVVMVVLALGILICRKAVHSAICMVGVMLCLAMLYVSLGAYFLGVVQVVVYTGAVMTLILFIIMMVGVTASDNYRRTRAYLRWGAGLLGFIGIVIFALVAWFSYLPLNGRIDPIVTNDGTTDSNPVIVAMAIFNDHMFTMEVVGCLLIIAAIGAMSLTHSDVLRKVFKQPETAEARMLDYAAHGTHPGQRPGPGVYADTNAVDAPAISGETEAGLDHSVMPALRARSAERTLAEVTPGTVAKIHEDKYGDKSKGLQSPEANRSVGYSGAWGMGNIADDASLEPPETKVIKPKLLEEETPHVAGTDTPTGAADSDGSVQATDDASEASGVEESDK